MPLIDLRFARLPAAFALAFGLALASCSDNSGAESAPAATRLPEGPDEMALGDPAAPIQVIEYASLTCSHCRAFHVGDGRTAAVLPRLKAQYIDTGKVRYVLREYPFDDYATTAFMLAHCTARDAGTARTERYFSAVDLLFRLQPEWAVAGETGEAIMDRLAGIMKEAGMGRAAFDACRQDQSLLSRIDAAVTEGTTKYGVSRTPTFLINGVKHEGALEFERFVEILDKAAPAPSGEIGAPAQP